MSLTHLLKSTLLRRQEGRIFSAAAWYRATPIHHQFSKIAPKIQGQPYTRQQPHPFRDNALYTAASMVLIMFPLLASASTLIDLAEDKYYHEVAYSEFMSWCQNNEDEFSKMPFKEFKDMYILHRYNKRYK